ncbi:MAG: hypothetical protein DRI88_10190 [Bacteroidetes bacterium]|nr:MAG: hypothetical protein DRI88_10190 [Bacteroidota bacterium]
MKLSVKIDCGSERKAKIINEALKIDNERYIESHVEGKYIVAKCEGEALSLLHTINDFFSCLQLAIELA